LGAYDPSFPRLPPYLGGYRCLGGYLLFDLPHSISLDAMATDPSPELKSLFEATLSEFEKRTGTNLIQHQIIDKLVNCESADSVIDVLQEQAQAFRDFRGDGGKIMTWVKRTVNVSYSLSTSNVLRENIGLVCVYSFH